MSYTKISTQGCIDWLRQKTRTASTDTSTQGEWADDVIVDYLNAAIREITTRMMTARLDGYFLRTDLGITTQQGIAVVGNSAPVDKYGFIRVGWVQFSVLGATKQGQVIRPMGVNRYIYTTTYQNPDSGMKPSDDKVFYIVRMVGHQGAAVDPLLAVQFLGLPPGNDIMVDIYSYTYPELLDANVPTAFVGLPPVAWNAMLSWAWLLLAEDERNGEMYGLAEKRFSDEIQALLAAAPLSDDMPIGAGMPVQQEVA